ncbi:MAG: hypothetical protein J4G05_00485 [Chlorobi bacterium]|nr:hypothetical protein [Chlorobiota bacterium]
MTIIQSTFSYVAVFLLTLSFIWAPDLSGQVIIESWEVFSALDRSTDVAVDGEGKVWVGSTGGAYQFDPVTREATVYRTNNGLLRLNVTAVGVDRESDDVYFGGDNGAISILRQGGWWTYVTDITRRSQSQRAINGFAFANGLAYILTEFGVAVFDPSDSVIRESWTRLGSIHPNTSVNDLVFYNDSVWLATPFGVAVAQSTGKYLADPSNWTVYDSVSLCSSLKALSLAVVDGSLLIGTADGGCEYIDGVFTKRGDLGGSIRFGTNGDQVVAGNDYRLYRREQNGLFREVGELSDRLTDVVALPDGSPLGSLKRTGVAFLSSDSVELFAPNGPSSNRFVDLTFGADGSLWGATFDDGVVRLNEGEWFNYDAANTVGLSTNSARQIEDDDFGRVWVSAYGDGMYIFQPENDGSSKVDVQHYDETNSPLRGINTNAAYVICSDIYADGFGTTWFINWDNTSGIRGAVLLASVYDPKTGVDNFHLFPASSTFPELTRAYARLSIDFNGTIWLASENQSGLLYFIPGQTLNDQGEWRRIRTADGLISNDQNALLVDPDGEVWIGTPKGLTVLVNPGAVRNNGSNAAIFREIRSLKDVVIRDIAVDALNRKWVGTDNGLFVLSSDGTELLETYTESNSSLVKNEVLAVLPNNKTGEIYIGTGSGLNKIQTEAIESSSDPDQIQVSPQPFDPTRDQSLRITGLPLNSRVKILKLDGSLITEFRAPGGDVGFWTGRDARGELVASGVYIVAAESALGETVIGKIAVVRQ